MLLKTNLYTSCILNGIGYRSQARKFSDMSFSECCKKLGFSNDAIVLGNIVDEELRHQQYDIIKSLSVLISFFSQVTFLNSIS
jgi:hypothetical protein